MHRMARRITGLRADERGVALPMALLGLLTVSLLMTTAVVTSSTEVALSVAHQDGTRGLYRADEALEGFIARRSVLPLPGTRLRRGSWMYRTGDGTDFSIVTEELHRSAVSVDSAGFWRRTDTWSLVAEPASGRGRTVGAQLLVTRTLPPFTFQANAGITVGGNLTVGGSSAISDGRNATQCDSTQRAENAIQVSDSSKVTVNGSGVTITGAVDTASYQKAQMVAELLGGRTIREAAQYATVQFPAGTFPTSPIRSWTNSGPKLQTDKTNWGCPAGLLADCALYAGSNVNYMPSVAIDAGGGQVKITGDHGQGVLLVYNGGLKIEGNFIYKGIILVEGDLYIRGTGGSTAKVEGAVVSLGANSTIEDDDTVTGNAVITYNRCYVNEVSNGFQVTGIGKADQVFSSPSFSWYEVVR